MLHRLLHRQIRRSERLSKSLCTQESVYAEQLQLKEIKSPEFYDTHAKNRLYFYHVDLQGQLFLEDTVPKNIATSLKSPKFLRFFFGHLRPNPHAGSTLDPFQDYPYISPCGNETNFIKAADTPIVFTELKQVDDATFHLVTNGSHDVVFNPSHVAMSSSTGRLYHWTETKHLALFALIKSQVAVELSQSIEFHDDGPHILTWQDQVYPLAMETTTPPPDKAKTPT
ncbi:hypothetical protein Ae201684_000204 [Aphanomyces euteiches]|uniref:Uncharacterized protein n=1 Tax=Aphanomyces euteiches TaxID=100861 RepID=A0A6G0XYZ5_9STRA|nr:hypothetical protein Ae201684_000204 [Aphanomyces euteiches]